MLCLSVSDLSLSFGTVPVLENVSFSLEENDRLGIIGVNGCGKSTLFRLICGELEPTSGAVYLSKGKTVGILRQDDAFDASDSRGTVLERMVHAFPDLLAAEARMAELEADALKRGDEAAVREYTDLHDRYVRDGGLEFRARCTSILSRLGFDEAQRNQPVGTLSGGQRTRLALAVQLSREPDILMLDEPTNHLDIATLTWLENFLAGYKKCFMVISHDRYFLDRVTNKTLSMPRSTKAATPKAWRSGKPTARLPSGIGGINSARLPVRKRILPNSGHGIASGTSLPPKADRRCSTKWSGSSVRPPTRARSGCPFPRRSLPETTFWKRVA